MIRNLCMFFLLLLSFESSSLAQKPKTRITPLQKTGGQIYKESKQGVVLIATNCGFFGSGFIIGVNLVATNRHVAECKEGGTVKIIQSDREIGYSSVWLDSNTDIAILKVSNLNGKVLSLGNDKAAEVGDDIFVIGNPKGLEGTFSKGSITGVRSNENLIQFDAPISSGSSGGPVLNSNGKVIGLATLTLKDSQNLNFAVPISALKDFLAEIKAKKVEDLLVKNNDSFPRKATNDTESKAITNKKNEPVIAPLPPNAPQIRKELLKIVNSVIYSSALGKVEDLQYWLSSDFSFTQYALVNPIDSFGKEIYTKDKNVQNKQNYIANLTKNFNLKRIEVAEISFSEGLPVMTVIVGYQPVNEGYYRQLNRLAFRQNQKNWEILKWERLSSTKLTAENFKSESKIEPNFVELMLEAADQLKAKNPQKALLTAKESLKRLSSDPERIAIYAPELHKIIVESYVLLGENENAIQYIIESLRKDESIEFNIRQIRKGRKIVYGKLTVKKNLISYEQDSEKVNLEALPNESFSVSDKEAVNLVYSTTNKILRVKFKRKKDNGKEKEETYEFLPSDTAYFVEQYRLKDDCSNCSDILYVLSLALQKIDKGI